MVSDLLAVLLGRARRYKSSLTDLSIVAAIGAVGAFAVWAVDVFKTEGDESGAGTRIELNEALLIGALLTLGLLIFAVRRLIAEKREGQRRRLAEQEARTLAFKDPLTGLANRRSFDDALNQAFKAPPGRELTHAILMMDLNGFKRVNDVFGHGVGDDVLTAIGQRLAGLIRQGDVVARLGGDEFAILAQHLTGPEAANGLGLRVIEALKAPVSAGATEHTIGVGVGVALFPRDADTASELMRKADIALYRAKSEGASSVRFFEEAMDAQVRERDLIARDLRAAIGTDALSCAYQPQIDLKSGKIVGFEALARWIHPEQGSIPPERFIAIAEDTGFIHEVTGWLLRQAARDARSWPADVVLSFNISPVELKDRTLGLRILSILGETGLPPGRLELEITESALVRDLEAAQQILGSLHDAGIKIALDDFGTGYSSLYHLQNFKLDKIKIDRSFIDKMQSEPQSAAIVQALVGLGLGLGLTVTAEGVETDQQADVLREGGCVQGQGYLYSQACSAQDAVRMFSSEPRKTA